MAAEEAHRARLRFRDGGTRRAPETGYAPVNGLQMYYEIHGSGGTPLLLLHGGLFNIDLQFGELLPAWPRAAR